MNLEIYREVSLTIDLPDDGLKAGDVATLIDFIPHPDGGEEGCILEVFDAVGESIAVVMVKKSAVKPLSSGQILSVRPLAQASRSS